MQPPEALTHYWHSHKSDYLGIFKYCNFFIDTTNSTLAFLHLQLVYIHPLKLLLPLGISFYTVRGDKLPGRCLQRCGACRDLLRLQLLHHVFPHLISGPIVRYRGITSQMKDGIFSVTEKRTEGL